MSTTTPSGQTTGDTPSNIEFEGEIREFIRKDVASRRKRPEVVGDTPPLQPGQPTQLSQSESVSILVQRVAGASLGEIDGVIDDLRGMREFLRNEGERVQREIAAYATVSQSAANSVRTIAESVAEWRRVVSAPPLFRG